MRRATSRSGRRPRMAAARVPGRGEKFDRALAQVAVTLFENRENRRHQSTFASFLSASISAGTAAAPSPMILPAGRSGGSESDTIVA